MREHYDCFNEIYEDFVMYASILEGGCVIIIFMSSLLSNIITKKLLRRRSRVSQALSRLRLFTAAQHSKLASAQLKEELKEKKLSKEKRKTQRRRTQPGKPGRSHLCIKGPSFPKILSLSCSLSFH